MKQIVDKLNKIAKAIDENVELPTTDLIIDSLDAITTAYGGTPNDSNLIVDKLEDIASVAHGGGGGGMNLIDLTVTVTPDASMTNGYYFAYNKLKTTPYLAYMHEYSQDEPLTTEQSFNDILCDFVADLLGGGGTYMTDIIPFDAGENLIPYVISNVNCTTQYFDGVITVEITDSSLPATVSVGFILPASS